jgi:hypothetical protein
MTVVTGSWEARRLRGGDGERCLYVVEDVVDVAVRESLYLGFRALPYLLNDSDRQDTQHIRHWVHEFSRDDMNKGVLKRLAALAAGFLVDHGHALGPLQRMYANLNLHGDFQYAHMDGDCWTTLLFVNPEWHADWSGELELYPEGEDAPSIGIQPKPGRMVVFDGLTLHRGGVPSKRCSLPRITLAIKFARGE